MLRYRFLIYVLTWSSVRAILTDEEQEKIQDYMFEADKSCAKSFGVSLDFLKQGDGDVNPCFIACVLKGRDLINEKGLYDVEKGRELIENIRKFITNEAAIAKMKKITETCAVVNDEKVSDGENGCWRAVLLIECLVEGKHELM